MDGRRITHADNRYVLLNPSQQTGEHFAGPELDEEIAITIEQALDAIGPADGARDLVLQRCSDLWQSYDGRAGHVAHDRKTRSLQGRFKQRFLELFVGAVHQPLI